MVDKYGTGQDHYTYPNSSILINKLGIKDEHQLLEAERDLSELAAVDIEFNEPPYDLDYWCNIHQKLFSDIYDWAGKIRTIDISKGATRFAQCSRITDAGNKLFESLASEYFLTDLPREDFIERIAHYYCELNILHPFRDGNGRAQRILFEHLIVNAGYSISYDLIDKPDWIQANIDGFNCDNSFLNLIFNKCISQS
jgi:cell filamentation protein